MRNPLKSNRPRAIVLALASLGTGHAGAALTVEAGDNLGGGTFEKIAYGLTGEIGQISPLLFAIDPFGSSLSGGAQPPGTQVSGTALDFTTAVATSHGGAVVDITYAFRNTGAAGNFTDLRLLIDVQPDGSPSFSDKVSESWGAPIAGDPDRRQITDFGLSPSLSAMQTNSAATDARNDCAGACDADFGLQWNRATLKPGETWTVTLRLVDDPSLVTGGRYLQAVSADTANTALIVGNAQLVPEPGTWAMLAAGLGMLPLLRRRLLAA
ncbi:MAG: PEP-CTERM sorting domain-containing protein [Burkholderiales bacterium]